MKNYLILLVLGCLAISCSQNGNYDLQSIEDSDWFPFTPENSFEQGVIGMKDWLDAPAGKHGFLQMNDDNLRFEDGTGIKLWGTNICSKLPYSDKQTADDFTAMLSKFGMNAVRFHKFSWYAYDGDESTKFDQEKFNHFDYFQHKLKESGIYYGWSHIYGHRVQPGDSSKLLAYSEIRDLEYPWSHLNGSTASLVNFAADLQDLSIELTVDMLNHTNPYTGLRYADDPALAFVEFQNEDNIFWGAIEKSLEQAPTYRRLLCQQFSEWLIKKYQTQESLLLAWGEGVLPRNQSLTEKNIYPQPNHGLFSHEYEIALEQGRPMATHILDKIAFLYDTQLKFYRRFEQAIRDTGYRGVLVGSCWQAGSGISHLSNLHADYVVGMIDRHNYFGGDAGGHRLDTGKVKNNAMVRVPGSGLLSAGMQQVVDRPFSFSEWMSLVPNQWTAEAAPLIAVYGMGLQGWDASFSFATDIPRFSKLLESEKHGVYNATSPLHMGLYPALARMIYRSDIQEAPVLLTRNVHIPSLKKGKVSFTELVNQGYDEKSFTGTIPSEALAIGRFPIEFSEEYKEITLPDLTVFVDSTNSLVESNTGELRWKYGVDGHFTINTPSTKGIVGFCPEEPISLGDWKIRVNHQFAVVLITSLDKDKTLAETKNILITAVSRGRNTGMHYDITGDNLLTTGDPPLLLEPVNVEIEVPGNRFLFEPLDQDGRSTGRVRPVDSTININTAEDETIWYRLSRS